MSGITALITGGVLMFSFFGVVMVISNMYNLNGIKSKTVGDGQHGTARWATKSEIKRTYKHIPFTPNRWREQDKNSQTPTTLDNKPLPQGIVVGCKNKGKNTTALIDTGDVHALMIERIF